MSVDFSNLSSMDAFDILGVHPNSSENEIRSAYLRLALQYHPDKMERNGTSADLNGAVNANGITIDPNVYFVKINEAWKALSDEKTRESLIVARLAAKKIDNLELNCEILPLSDFEQTPGGDFSRLCRCGGTFEVSCLCP